MEGEGVKIIGARTSFFCTRIEWALKLKGVKYEYVQEDLLNKSPMLLKYNPVHKKVPVLVLDGKPVAESLVILEYVDEAWCREYPLLSEDPYAKALTRFWAKFGDEKCLVSCWEAHKSEGKERESAIESAQESLGYLEKQLEGKKYFGGENINYLDLAVGWIPLWLGVMEEVGNVKLLDPLRFPLLHDWSNRFIEIPIIKQCLPPRDLLLNYFTAALEYLRSLPAEKP